MKPEPIKILLVDDIPENLIALSALLRRDDLQLLEAHSGQQALELLLEHDVALALLDVQMPELDGFELAELMRGMEKTRHVPIIFVTAGARDPKRVFKGYESGAVDFLFKPIEPHVLKSKVDVFVELAKQKAEVARILHLNEVFMGILGHDLRNPLGAMLVGTELLMETAASDLQRKTLTRMQAAGKRMGAMIEQLLDLTRARIGGGLASPTKRTPLDVRMLVQRAVDELKTVHPDREVALEAAGDCSAFGDPDRLLQLFSNLVGNAIAHSPKTSGVRVGVTCAPGDTIEVAIANQGAIPQELLPAIFEPFRGRGTKSAASAGLGLGLFISREIATAHGGEITVTSSPEAGTCFTVRLPRHARAAVA